jgi:hypothetical protein
MERLRKTTINLSQSSHSPDRVQILKLVNTKQKAYTARESNNWDESTWEKETMKVTEWEKMKEEFEEEKK